MDGTRNLNALFITGGTDSGIMKYVGEARAKYNPAAALIGIAPIGPIAGGRFLTESQDKELDPKSEEQVCSYAYLCDEDRKLREKAKQEKTWPKKEKVMAHLDRNHSHFILVQNEKGSGFGSENDLRACFEKALREAHWSSRFKSQITLDKTFEHDKYEDFHKKGEDSAPVPIICVSVQGGPGTIKTVHGSVCNDIPAMVVRGSGKASDLIADIVIMIQHRKMPECYEQLALWKILENPKVMPDLEKYIREHDEEVVQKKRGKLFDYSIEYFKGRIDSLEKGKEDDMDEQMQKLMYSVYKVAGLKTDASKPVEPIRNAYTWLRLALEAAKSCNVSVFDFQKASGEGSEDFNAALLKCLLRGSHALHSDTEKEAAWKRIKYTMLWDRDDLIHSELSSCLPKLSMPERNDLLQKALVYSIERNKVNGLRACIEFNASIDDFDLGWKASYVQFSQDIINGVRDAKSINNMLELNQEKYKQYFEGAENWKKIIEAGKNDPVFAHVWGLIDKKSPQKQSQNLNEDRKRIKKWLNAPTDSSMHIAPVPLHPIHPKTRDSLLRHQRFEMDEATAKESEWKKIQTNLKLCEMLNQLERLFIHFLSSRFLYRMNILGPSFDLFLFLVVSNRRELAFEMYRQVRFPVRSALIAAALLRSLAKEYANQDPLVSRQMLQNADFFEGQAIEIQLEAVEDDESTALTSLDTPVNLYRGYTVLDLAIESRSLKFMESCCQEAIHKSLYGDLDAFHMKHPEGQLLIFLGIVTLGLLPMCSTGWFKWLPPPSAPSKRLSKQRRSVPKGYPDRPCENNELKMELEREIKQSKPEEFKSGTRLTEEELTHFFEMLTPGEREVLWELVLSRFEKLYLFWESPVVLFYAEKLTSISITIAFTSWFIDKRLDDGGNKLSTMPIQGFEIFLCIYFGASIVREFLQMFLSVQNKETYWLATLDYVSDFWNLLDPVEVVAFFVGLAYRLQCRSSLLSVSPATMHSAGICLELKLEEQEGWKHSGDVLVRWTTAYGVCLFVSWFRFLRSFALLVLPVMWSCSGAIM